MREEDEDLGFMRDTAAYFGAKASDEEFAALAGDRTEDDVRDGVVEQPAAAPVAVPDLVLTLDSGQVQVTVAASEYLRLMADAVACPASGIQSKSVAYNLKLAAEKRGLLALAEEFDRLHKDTMPGPIMVKRPDGSFYHGPARTEPTPATADESALAAEREATAIEISEFFEEE